ncbi:MAG: peptidase [Gammaproteobacteria bacterium RIFCSPLOWO2_02_FULL_61_13]|nr:MAG: peptidase [Gammaproteobacteria bacterium RIFCSPLOWO2_02_FULL_61_13]
MEEFSLIQKITLGVVPVVFAITVHEVAHGWVASRLGDQTARLLGRLTLNPIKHMDPVGTVILPLLLLVFGGFIFGWAKPVPVDWRNLRRPRRDMALVAVAGPGANLVMLLIWAMFGRYLIAQQGTWGDAVAPWFYMVGVGITINIALIVLNLLPLPPLDGSRIVAALLPPRQAAQYNGLERWGILILLGLLATGILNQIMLPPMRFIYQLVQDFLLR